MSFFSIYLILFVAIFFIPAFAQDSSKSNELVVSDEDQIIIFTIAILIVVGIFIFMARNIIRRKKTSYDNSEFSSKKDRDYEKYHSGWSDDYEELGSKSTSEYEEEFRKAANESTLPNYYLILGVEKNAPHNEIKQKFRKLAKELHPDKTKNSNSENKMAEINKAYEVLSDKERRERYDKYLNVS